MILDFTGGTLQTHGQLVLHGPNGPQMSQKPPEIGYSDPQGGLLISTALLTIIYKSIYIQRHEWSKDLHPKMSLLYHVLSGLLCSLRCLLDIM